MEKTLLELYGKLSSEYWMYVFIAVVAVAFLISLIAGLVAGDFAKIKSNMKGASGKSANVIAYMKKMPATIKGLYKTARLANVKPSSLVTEDVCVDKPYNRSLLSKVWLVTFVATVICGGCASLLSSIACPLVLIIGGLLTLIGGIIGRAAHSGAVKTYNKFAPLMDGDQPAAPQAQQAYAQQPQAQGQAVHEAQATYEEARTYEAQTYEAQATYAEQPTYGAQPYNDSFDDEPPVVMQQPQESDEEIRKRAREEAMAQARAQQAQAQSQAQAQAQARAQAAQPKAQPQHTAAQPTGSSSADEVIARIEAISRDGAPRETMREVATMLQKERAKPENKTPEQQKRLNEALSKLLKAMSAATKK